MITFRRFAYAVAFLLVMVLSVSASPVFAHHSVSSYKWIERPVDVGVHSSLPSNWITILGRSMSTWNNAGSRFRFRSWNNGHMVSRSSWGQGGVAQTTITKGDYIILDTDTTFNSYYAWCDGAVSGCYDLQSVMTHELGHWLMLYDLYEAGDYAYTMYYKAISNNTRWRSLEWDDISSIRNMYGIL